MQARVVAGARASARRAIARRTLAPLLAFVLAPGLVLTPSLVRADVSEPDEDEVTALEGVASWYGGKFHGRQTACGETYDQDGMTAAHRTLPFGTLIAVTNLDNGCRVTVRVTDRGPYKEGRILDLSRAAADSLCYLDRGVAHVRWEVVKWPKARRKARMRPPVAATPPPITLPAAATLPAEVPAPVDAPVAEDGEPGQSDAS